MNSDRTHIQIADYFQDLAVLIGAEQDTAVSLSTGEVINKPGLNIANYPYALEASGERWRHGITNIPVIGGMSAGKSTFLNGWLGTDLPTGPGAVTGIVLELTAEAFDGFRVFYADETEKTMDAEAYRDFNVVEDGGSIVGGNAFRLPAHLQPVLYARLGRLRGLPEKGLVFVDTLGFNAGGAAAATTRGYLNNADIIIMVLSGQQLFTETDVEVLQHIAARDIEREDVEDASIFFVININVQAMDTDEKKELVRKQVSAKLEGLVPAEDIPHRVFLVDALTALNLTRAGESGAALEATGLPAFQRSLEAAIETGDLLQAKLERTMDQHVRPAIDEARQEIQLKREALQLNDAQREDVIKRARSFYDEAAAEKQKVLSEFDSLIGKVAQRVNTLFQNQFASKIGDKELWRKKWLDAAPTIGFFATLKGIIPGPKADARRKALEDKLRPSIESMIQSQIDAWARELPNHLEGYFDQAQNLEGFNKTLEAFHHNLKTGDAAVQIADFGDIDVVQSDQNWKRLIFGLIGIGLMDYNTVGVVYAPNLKSFLRRITTHLVFGTAAVLFLGPAGLVMVILYSIAELIMNFQLDKKSSRSQLSDKIADEIRKHFATEGPNIGQKMEERVIGGFAKNRQKLEEALDDELNGREERLESLRRHQLSGKADTQKEQERLDGIDAAITRICEAMSENA